MKQRNDLLSGILDALLGAVMAFAGIACLITAFRLEADLTAVALTAAAAAFVTALLARIKHGWAILLPLLALGGFLLHTWGLENNFGATVCQVLVLYNRGYGWPIPEFLTQCDAWNFTLSFQALAGFFAVCSTWNLSKCRSSLAALALILPIAPTIVITDTVPAAGWLLLAIGTMVLLALTALSRQRDTRQTNRLIALLLIPILLFGMVLFVYLPQDGYTPPNPSEGMFALMDKLATWFPFLQGSGSGGLPIGPPQMVDEVKLSNLGYNPEQNTTLLSVLASESGMLYLRGRSYTDYTGLSWLALEGTETMPHPDSKLLQDKTQTMQILYHFTPAANRMLYYFPYYVTGNVTLEGGSLFGQSTLGSAYSYRPLKNRWENIWMLHYGSASLQDPQLDPYLQLPDGVAEDLASYLWRAQVTEDLNPYEAAQRIRNFVRDCAVYSLKTGPMPSYEPDFALWFLEYGNTGYCVHFASAAVVMLRAAGIPARYVEGYLVDARAGHMVEVTGNQAHAWAEYYLPGAGWVVLEATPDDGLPLPPATQPPTEGPTTKPTEPTEPTVPTNPTEPTDPTEPTEPTGPTGPTGPTEPTGPAGPTDPTVPPTGKPTVPTEPTVPTVPPATDPGGNDLAKQPDLSWLKPVLTWLGVVLAAVAALWAQWKTRIELRKKAMEGTSWKAVYRRWQYTQLLCRLCRRQPPKFLLDLLKKAKFSRDGLDDADLRRFTRYHNACIRGMRKQSLPVRLFCRLFLAAW